jgi:hypothetical protein
MSMTDGKNHIVSPLSTWFNRSHPIPARFYERHFADDVDSENWSVWVSLEEVSPLCKVRG